MNEMFNTSIRDCIPMGRIGMECFTDQSGAASNDTCTHLLNSYFCSQCTRKYRYYRNAACDVETLFDFVKGAMHQMYGIAILQYRFKPVLGVILHVHQYKATEHCNG